MPAGFRNWAEYEDRAARIRDWTPAIVTGLLQTEDYARVLSALRAGDQWRGGRCPAGRPHGPTAPRPDPAGAPVGVFVVDEFALYRRVGSPR